MLLLLILTTLTTGSSLAQQSVLLTGGFNGAEGARSGCSLLDSACPIPSLPVSEGTGSDARSDHFVAQTEDGLVLTCGGEAAEGTDDLSCVSLDLTSSPPHWTQHSIMDAPRIKATAVTLPGLGVVALGGFKEQGASVLRTGATEWEAGVLPDLFGTVDEVSYYGICSVMLADKDRFLVVGGNPHDLFGGTMVQEYDPLTGRWEMWPVLEVGS